MKNLFKIIALVFMMFTSTLLWADAAEKYEPPRTPNSGGVTTGGGGRPANDPRYNLPSASNDDNYFPKNVRPPVQSLRFCVWVMLCLWVKQLQKQLDKELIGF